jgi:hypothetical protein
MLVDDGWRWVDASRLGSGVEFLVTDRRYAAGRKGYPKAYARLPQREEARWLRFGG